MHNTKPLNAKKPLISKTGIKGIMSQLKNRDSMPLVTVPLKPSTKAQYTDLAKQNGVKRAALLRAACEWAIQNTEFLEALKE